MLTIVVCSCGLNVYESFIHYHKSTNLHKKRILKYQKLTMKERFVRNKSLLSKTGSDIISDNIITNIKWDVIDIVGENIQPLDFIKDIE